MADYRLYWLNDVGKIASAEWIEAKSDDEAVVMVRARKLPLKCEIWDRQRLVADVPASADHASPVVDFPDGAAPEEE